MTTTDLVPGQYPVAIDGQPFALAVEAYERATLDTIREQADTSREPGEQSLNPHDLWRRSRSDWYLGTGQEWADRPDSVPVRSWKAQGVNVWDRGALTLLKDTARIDAFSAPIGQALVANGRIYVNRSTLVSFWNGTTWTDCSGIPAGQTVQSMATDGFNVYLAVRDAGATVGGVYILTGTSNVATKINNLIPDLVGFQLGRIMVAADEDVYNITDLASLTAPSPLTTMVNSEWEWDAFGEGPNYIYAAGHSSDTSLIYRFGIREDGTALQAGAVARQMPDGETVNVIRLYRGLVVLGTSKGLRIAVPQGPSLQEGRLVEVGPVYDLEPQGDHVWFTWSELEDGNAGLGRIDLGAFVKQLTPAYAPDLSSGAIGTARSVLTYGGRRVFVVDGVGVYRESDSYLTSGWIESGKWTHGLDEKKVFYALEGRHKALAVNEAVRFELYIDDAGSASIDQTSNTDGATDAGPWSQQTTKGEYANLKLTLSGDGTTTPTVTRWLARSFPIPRRSEAFLLPLDLSRTVAVYGGRREGQSPETLFAALKTLEKAGLPVEYQEWGTTKRAFIDRVHMGPGLREDSALDDRWWEGPCMVTLRVFEV